MNLKLDENLGEGVAERFRRAGHDVATVQRQGLAGVPDGERAAPAATVAAAQSW